MASHKKILAKKQIAKLRNYLWDSFHLPHEHYGFENSKTTDFIVNLSVKYCEKKQFINRTDKSNPFFRDQFLITIVSPILQSFKTKYHKVRQEDGTFRSIKNKWFLRCFECEKIGMSYHYYYPKNQEELNRIVERDAVLVENKETNFKIRYTERKEYAKQLPGHVKPKDYLSVIRDRDAPSLPNHNDRDKDVV